jgi:hypothetical protein
MENLEKLKYAIVQNKSGYIVVYDSNNEKIGTFENKNSQELAEEVSLFVETWGAGEYKFMLKSSVNMKPENASHYTTKYYPNATENKASNPIQNFDMEKLRQEVKLEVKAEFETIRKQKTLEEREEGIRLRERELDSGAQRLQELIVKAIMPLISPQPQPVLQGNSVEETFNNMIPTFGNSSEEPEEIYNEAFEILKKFVDAPTLMQFARKIESQPAVVEQLKMLL